MASSQIASRLKGSPRGCGRALSTPPCAAADVLQVATEGIRPRPSQNVGTKARGVLLISPRKGEPSKRTPKSSRDKGAKANRARSFGTELFKGLDPRKLTGRPDATKSQTRSLEFPPKARVEVWAWLAMVGYGWLCLNLFGCLIH